MAALKRAANKLFNLRTKDESKDHVSYTFVNSDLDLFRAIKAPEERQKMDWQEMRLEKQLQSIQEIGESEQVE